MTDRELMQMALDALDKISMGGDPRWADDVTPALRARLAQPEPEPVACPYCHYSHTLGAVYFDQNCAGCVKRMTAPPQREWQGAQPEPKPLAHSVVAGALFDFMGWLTSRKERIVLSSADNASPAVEVITEFAKMRGLSLDNAKVQDWHIASPQREWQGLTDEEMMMIYGQSHEGKKYSLGRAIEAKLKEKNHAI